jgi:pimeloyl-ACP methyl ester carboxylesterase
MLLEAPVGPLAFTRAGSGEPLVLIHALGADRRMWDPVLGLLAAERDVIAVDLPGFGGSRAVSPARPIDLAASVAAQLSALGVSRPAVAGVSLGGWVALELALAGETSAVTAIAPAGLWSAPLEPRRSTARTVARALSPALPLILSSRRGRRLALSSNVGHPDRVPYEDALRLVRTYAQSPGFVAVNAAMRAARFAELAEITVPVVLAWPDLDRIVTRPRVLPGNVRNVVLRGCGHMPTWDDPEQVAALLLGR